MTTPTPSGEGPEWAEGWMQDISQRTARVLLAAVGMDGDTVGRQVEHIGETYGHRGVYSMCNAIAEAVKQMAFPSAGEESVAELEMLDGSNPDDLPRDARGDLFAARFVAAHVNGDDGMKLALFSAPISGGDDRQTIANVIALIAMAGSIGRHKLEQAGCGDEH